MSRRRQARCSRSRMAREYCVSIDLLRAGWSWGSWLALLPYPLLPSLSSIPASGTPSHVCTSCTLSRNQGSSIKALHAMRLCFNQLSAHLCLLLPGVPCPACTSCTPPPSTRWWCTTASASLGLTTRCCACGPWTSLITCWRYVVLLYAWVADIYGHTLVSDHTIVMCT